MESITFITIHDLSDEARILYSSDSIVDILGYTPDMVVNTSAWDWFRPDEVPFAKEKHQRGVKLDKAAVLVYAHIKSREGNYVNCECCFSVVYNVMVCCTSIYRPDAASQKRAEDAPLVRRLFSSSPKDPRYHMLTHLSNKFSQGDELQTHEPRAALFLNRFTRTLTIMYATSGIEEIIGISSEDMKGRSFYYCIQEECLTDATRCLEGAKGNDSIAYLRFRFRDPRRDDPVEGTPSESEDETMTDIMSDDESESIASGHSRPSNSRHESGNSNISADTHNASIGSLPTGTPQSEDRPEDIELEAVVSCTSDGLVVCLRRARPILPTMQVPFTQPAHHGGIFTAPWAHNPVFQPALPQMPPFPLGAQHPAMAQAGPPGVIQSAFLEAIRDVAVFAWGLTGINGSLASYAKGNPGGEAQPHDGFPVWSPNIDPNNIDPNNIDPNMRGEYPRAEYSATPSGYYSATNYSSSNFD